MSWVVPRTWVAGEVMTAANMNGLRDSLLALSTYTSFTPTLTAATANPNLGATGSASGYYSKFGNKLEGEGVIVFGGAGVSAGTGNYYIEMPATLLPTGPGVPLGEARLFDSSGTQVGRAMLVYQDATHVYLSQLSGSSMGGFGVVTGASPMTWAAGDRIEFTVKCKV